MGQPIDAYREGYEKGRKQTAGDALAQITMGMLRDDPGGYFAAGYHDGAAGKKFSLPHNEGRKEAAELNPFDDKVAIKTICPNCGALDWFEWKFLGRLKDPICGHTWYAGSGTYALMQIRAAFQFGRRFARYMTSGKSRSSTSAGEVAVGWVAKGVFWTAGALLGIGMRLEFGLLMIPIQALVGLCQPRKTATEVVSRSIVLGVSVVALGVLAFEVRQKASAIPVASPNVVASVPPVGRSGTSSPVRTGRKQSNESFRRMILGKWYPTNTVPRAIRAGFVFETTGELLSVPYRWVDGSDQPDSSPSKGKWSIENRKLTFDGNSSWSIVRITKDELVLEAGGGGPIIFSRNPGNLKRF